MVCGLQVALLVEVTGYVFKVCASPYKPFSKARRALIDLVTI
jgi:hypothetical protein